MNYHLRKQINNCWCVVCLLIGIGIAFNFGLSTFGTIIGAIVGLILYFIEFFIYMFMKGAGAAKKSGIKGLTCPECLVIANEETGICPECGRKL